MLAFERRDLLRTNFGASIWYSVAAPLGSRSRSVGSGSNPIRATRARRLRGSRRSDLAALNLALRRREETPLAARLPAVPTVVPALVNVSIRRGVKVPPAPGRLPDGGKQLRAMRQVALARGLRTGVRIQGKRVCRRRPLRGTSGPLESAIQRGVPGVGLALRRPRCGTRAPVMRRDAGA